MSGFIIYGLPRSRTYWLSQFLTYRDWQCDHDAVRNCRSLADVKAWFSQPGMGTVETSAAPWWRLVKQYAPDTRIAVVRRPVGEVVASLARLSPAMDAAKATAYLTRLNVKLDQIEARVPGALSVSFDDLATEAGCRRIFVHCLPYQHDAGWWALLASLNLQVNMQRVTKHYEAHKDQLAALGGMAGQKIREGFERHYSTDGMTIEQVSFDTFLDKGRHLFAEHLLEVGEPPDAYLAKNIPVMRGLYETGAMQVTVAHSNGRMFGYLMAIIGPSLEQEGRTSAMHLTFYASKDAPGLGLKLQRSSIEALRERGIDEVLMRAGTRGSGPRMGALYRRLGAVDYGQLYMLPLKAN